MYVIGEVLNCKPGRVRHMVEKFRQISNVLLRHGANPHGQPDSPKGSLAESGNRYLPLGRELLKL